MRNGCVLRRCVGKQKARRLALTGSDEPRKDLSILYQRDAQSASPTFWAAPELAKTGYPVFPVGPDKTPSVLGGFYAATKDASQIAEWITEGREDHDIAIPTGLVTLTVVIDADTAAAYEKMRARFGEPHAETKRGGIENRRIQHDPADCCRALAGLHRHHTVTRVAATSAFKN